MLVTVYRCKDPGFCLSFPFGRSDNHDPTEPVQGKVCVVFVDAESGVTDTAHKQVMRSMKCRVGVLTSSDKFTRDRLKAAAPKFGFAGCDPTAASVENAIRAALEPHMLMVGRAINTPVPKPIEAMFGKVCYVKCTANHAGKPNYICCSSDSAVIYVHPKFAEFHRGCDVKVYTPEKWENKRRMGNPSRVPSNLKTFTSGAQYKHLPDLKMQTPGWLTTGTAMLFHMVFENQFDGDIFMYGFSHFDEDGNVVTPPKGMQNAFGRPAGRHNVDFEKRAMDLLAETGRIVPLHVREIYSEVPEHIPIPVANPKQHSPPKKQVKRNVPPVIVNRKGDDTRAEPVAKPSSAGAHSDLVVVGVFESEVDRLAFAESVSKNMPFATLACYTQTDGVRGIDVRKHEFYRTWFENNRSTIPREYGGEFDGTMFKVVRRTVTRLVYSIALFDQFEFGKRVVFLGRGPDKPVSRADLEGHDVEYSCGSRNKRAKNFYHGYFNVMGGEKTRPVVDEIRRLYENSHRNWRNFEKWDHHYVWRHVLQKQTSNDFYAANHVLRSGATCKDWASPAAQFPPGNLNEFYVVQEQCSGR